ncbi:hypothetical protein BBF93_16890 [Hyphomonas sp. CACIAM 19H1]|uniref:hypothetical protein n=1 Tax=Hyphomonas sp. CACIAM 19H1 TaxID=1873716 RepID=UPI000DEE036F|nr:hypothetical protein [Hyphomonas sp. CACIAM 19H1]AXE65719.1 hypothetical protein BBF93_16890 [Hyphomonas sp. CACIAM 19H1]
MRLLAAASVTAISLVLLGACGPASVPADQPDAVEAAADAEEAAGPETAAASAPRLEQLWVTDGFDAPEGAALAPDGSYFISNVTGDGSTKEGKGFVSKLGADGTMLMLRWAEGLDAPKGMTVLGDTLYVADIDQVVTFDVHNGTKRDTISIDSAQMLNDMTVWQGEVLVSDSGAASIHRLTPEGPRLLGASTDWAGINGLLGDGERLLISTMAEGYLIELRGADAEQILARGMKDADGVGLVPGGGYLVSSWPGHIHYVSEDGQVTTLLDTQAGGILQNDLAVFGDVVIVPNWLPGTVTAWRVVRD